MLNLGKGCSIYDSTFSSSIKVYTKNMLLAKDIFQIMYQLAVDAGIVINAF